MSSTSTATPNKQLHQVFDVVNRAMGAPATNSVCSPFNVATCFSMLADGATGPCREELIKFFGFSTTPQDISLTGNVGETFKQILKGTGPIAEMVKTAQAIFTTGAIKESYSKQIEQNYRALAKKIDPSDAAGTVKLVNDFVSKNTEGKIPEILSATDIDSSTVLVLVAALYFKGKWATPFKKENTSDRDFFLSDGTTTKKVPTMFGSKMKNVNFIETGNLQTIGLPYTGGLPHIGSLMFVAESWTAESGRKGLPPSDLPNIMLAATQESYGSGTTDVYLPKFKIEAKAGLIPAMKEAGVTNIFQASSNWQPICDSDPLFISVVSHRAMVEVDEEGTVAAAATVAVASRCAPRPSPVANFNRPFHFHIVDKKNKTILFSGSVVDPTM